MLHVEDRPEKREQNVGFEIFNLIFNQSFAEENID